MTPNSVPNTSYHPLSTLRSWMNGLSETGRGIFLNTLQLAAAAALAWSTAVVTHGSFWHLFFEQIILLGVSTGLSRMVTTLGTHWGWSNHTTVWVLTALAGAWWMTMWTASGIERWFIVAGLFLFLADSANARMDVEGNRDVHWHIAGSLSHGNSTVIEPTHRGPAVIWLGATPDASSKDRPLVGSAHRSEPVTKRRLVPLPIVSS